jgi:exo-beta-1,3-glucanase (GH17 family)
MQARFRLSVAVLATATLALAAVPTTATANALPDFGADTHWVGYGHTNPVTGSTALADLELLKNAGATGIISYASTDGYGLTEVPIANELGLKVILGVEDPTNVKEDNQAGVLWAEFPNTVVAINVGNEGLCTGKYTWTQLASAMSAFEHDTTAAVTTSEPWYEYDAAITGSTASLGYCRPTINPGLLSAGDYLSPNVYSYRGLENQSDTVGPCYPIDTPQANADWTYNEMSYIRGHTLEPVFLHETGYPADSGFNPTGGYCTQARQAGYFCALRSLTTGFAHFDGIDDVDGQDYLGKYGGLFSSARQEKQAGTDLSTC